MAGFDLTAPGISFSGGFTITNAPGPTPGNIGATAAWFGGGWAPSTPSFVAVSSFDRITFATDTAQSTVRGALSAATFYLAAAGNTTYGWFGGGSTVLNPLTNTSRINRITYATDTATTSIRGPLSVAQNWLSATSNSTDGWWAGGYKPGSKSTVSRITYATDTATASVRGPLGAVKYKASAAGNSTDGWWIAGNGPTSLVFRTTYATDTATASTRGPARATALQAATSNATDVWAGGGADQGVSPGAAALRSTVVRITAATDTATASTRGPLSLARQALSAAGNLTDGWFGGGYLVPGTCSRVDRITYATDTNTASARGPIARSSFIAAAASGIQ